MKYHILLVEDDAANLLVASTYLEHWGCTYKIARNGLEAVQDATMNSFDAVLMDIKMPELDGFKATEMIRQFEQLHNRPSVAIIGVTAHALVGDRTRGLEAGMDAYISKPFQEAELRRVLDMYVNGMPQSKAHLK